ncbi:hypothetical protein [Paenibacillus glycinis]|uniref:Uncharacterized protein n=1 Tax=Paenibacillus glycinis TaxID=2697035 RepID=A0ABW9XRY2_9BACL|nr:hypothetical protein [Paenibacillus glycinis]NBD25411.1 hypothetical protein [Paenibacillus glycinis]
MENINSSDYFHDLDLFRTPSEMQSYFESKREEIISNKELNDLARLKTGRYKIFLEEFYLLYLFSRSKLVPIDAKVRVVIGNQSYDAIVQYSTGEIKRYEITEFIYGKSEYEDAVLINERGYSKMRIGDTRDLETKAMEYLEEVIRNANKKAIKNYERVSIIIVMNTHIHLDIWNLNTELFIRKAIDRIRQLPFNCNEVLLLIRNNDPIELIDSNIYKVL